MKEKTIVSTFTLAASLAAYYYAKHLRKDTLPYVMIGGFLGAVLGTLIWGRDAMLAVPRSSTSAATIVLVAEGVVPEHSSPQMVTALLNGTPLGTVAAERGWHDLRFQAPGDLWIAGANTLTLQCATTTRPVDVDLGDDAHHIALGIRRVEIVDSGAGAR